MRASQIGKIVTSTHGKMAEVCCSDGPVHNSVEKSSRGATWWAKMRGDAFGQLYEIPTGAVASS